MIRREVDGDLWRIVIDRPDKANALSAAMLADLRDHFRAAHGVAKVVVLTGTGKVFSAGADLDEVASGLGTSPLWAELAQAIADLPCLTIAALNGTLAGGAFGPALACDLRVSVQGAKFFYPVMLRGYLPQGGDAKRLRELVGPARAKMILMAAAKITDAEALDWGIIDRLVPTDELWPTVQELSAACLAADPSLIAAIKAKI